VILAFCSIKKGEEFETRAYFSHWSMMYHVE
jgi:hypothetical protein